MDINLLKVYVMAFLGKPYFYGGDDPVSGFDCSGFVSEILRASGVAPWNYRDNAQGIFNLLHLKYKPCLPQLGAIIFFGKAPGFISHVGFCINEFVMIEAGGGTSETVTNDAAIKRNAFVRLRPINYRKDVVEILWPSYPACQNPLSEI